MESAASPLRPSRRAQVGRERPPFLGRWSAQNPPGYASGRSRPLCAKTVLPADIVDDIPDDADVDSIVVSERDIRVEHHDFNLVDTSRIARELLKSSRSLRRRVEPEVNQARRPLHSLAVARGVDGTPLGP